MKPIKFRGRDVHTGEYVFGFYTTGSDDKSFIIINSAQGQYLREVEPDSIAQLVGYDANGNEVYEGDTVIEEYVSGKRQEHIAHLVSMTQVPETAEFFFFPFPAPFTTLKEADQ